MEFSASARIFANDHRLIEISAGGWRLLHVNGNSEGDVLAEAVPGAPLRYPSVFATRLRLPAGELDPAAVERVVLGWSAADDMWHLGLIVAPELAQSRGSRWCGLARWHDPTAEAHRSESAEAARALAQALARPLSIVPPRAGEVTAAPEAPAAPPPPLRELPYTVDEWHVTAPAEAQLRLELRSGWVRTRVIRAVLYAVWALTFLILSVTSYTSGIMLPEPKFLPILGFLSAAWLFFLALRTLFLMRRQPRAIVVDGNAGTVQSSTFQISADQIESVVASQAVKVKRGDPADEHVRYGELHLRLRDGSYQPLATQLRFDVKLPALPAEVEAGSALLPLTEYSARTLLQSTAVRTARLLNVPAWTDRRAE